MTMAHVDLLGGACNPYSRHYNLAKERGVIVVLAVLRG